MVIDEDKFKKLKNKEKILYPEIYTVKFWAKKNGIWEQKTINYRGKKKGLHLTVRSNFEKKYPDYRIINIFFH